MKPANQFIDKCNDCGVPIVINMDTFIFDASCSCDSDIKRAIVETGQQQRKIDRECEEFKRRCLDLAGL